MEGFIKQDTEYSFNVFVYDDASTDGTSDILREYQDMYPELLDVNISNRNIFKAPDYNKLLIELLQKHIVGRYVAMCEGDDYWTDTNKLQEQIDYLEEHPECVMVAHSCNRLDCEKNISYEYRPYNGNQILSPEQVIMQRTGNLPTASLVMRKDILINGFKFVPCDVGDIPMQLYALYKGQIYYMDKIMSVYRYGGKGSWTERLKRDEEFLLVHYIRMIGFLDKYNIYTLNKFKKYINRKKLIYQQYIINNYNNSKIDDFITLCEQNNKNSNFIFNKYYEEIQRIFLLLHDGTDDKYIQEFIGKYSHIVIWGTGRFSELVINNIENFDNIDGFVVSDGQPLKNKHHGKCVWEIGNIPFDIRQTGIIAAVNIGFWNEIYTNLKDVGCADYLYPFVIQD
jgi:hypothetical protein